MAEGWGARGTLGLPWQDMHLVWKVAKPVSVPADLPGAGAAGASGVWAWPQLSAAPKPPSSPTSAKAPAVIQRFTCDPSASGLSPANPEQGIAGAEAQAFVRRQPLTPLPGLGRAGGQISTESAGPPRPSGRVFVWFVWFVVPTCRAAASQTPQEYRPRTTRTTRTGGWRSPALLLTWSRQSRARRPPGERLWGGCRHRYVSSDDCGQQFSQCSC